MATSGVKSNMLALGMTRHSGARISSVVLSKTRVSVLGLVRN